MFYQYETEKYKERQAQEAMRQAQKELWLKPRSRQVSPLTRAARGTIHFIGHAFLAAGERLDRLERSDAVLSQRSV